jgi:hypothetical protein
MALLFIVYAVSMGAGTLSKANTIPTQQNLIYNAWWFEAIHVFFMINFIGNIKRYQLLKKRENFLLLLFFLFILGAFVTRYISYEGMMPIRRCR